MVDERPMVFGSRCSRHAIATLCGGDGAEICSTLRVDQRHCAIRSAVSGRGVRMGNDLGTLKKDRFIYVISQVIRILGLDFTLHYVSIVLGVSRVYIYILFWCFLGDLGKWEKSI